MCTLCLNKDWGCLTFIYICHHTNVNPIGRVLVKPNEQMFVHLVLSHSEQWGWAQLTLKEGEKYLRPLCSSVSFTLSEQGGWGHFRLVVGSTLERIICGYLVGPLTHILPGLVSHPLQNYLSKRPILNSLNTLLKRACCDHA